MAPRPDADLTSGAAARQAALRRQATSNCGGSPQALEVGLAQLSAEVTAEAIARLAMNRKK